MALLDEPQMSLRDRGRRDDAASVGVPRPALRWFWRRPTENPKLQLWSRRSQREHLATGPSPGTHRNSPRFLVLQQNPQNNGRNGTNRF